MRARTVVNTVGRWVKKFLELMREGLEQQGKDYYWWHDFGDY